MAIIKCPECGKDVSDKAAACPYCGCPIAATASAPTVNREEEIKKYCALAVSGIQAQNSEQVYTYCQKVIEIQPDNSRAWELEARGLLFNSTLKENKVLQAITAADNAVCYTSENKEELAESLYDAIYPHITGLLNIALSMPVMYASNYVAQCMNYYGALISGISFLPKSKINKELAAFKEMDEKSKRSIMPRSRMIYASRVGKPSWDEQFISLLKTKGRI